MFKLEECVSYLASREVKQLSEALEKRLIPLGITRVQWMTLYYIATDSEVSQKELAVKMGCKEPTMVRLLDRMEKEKLVKRVRKDRRTNAILLTEEGRDLYERGSVIAEQFKNDAIREIPEEYMDHFSWVLDKMIENTITDAEG